MRLSLFSTDVVAMSLPPSSLLPRLVKLRINNLILNLCCALRKKGTLSMMFAIINISRI